MKRKRRNFSAEQKTKIVLEILQGDETLNQIASRYEIAPKVLQNWKKQFLENASLAFEPATVVKEYKNEISEKDREIEELHKALGKTTVERDWAVKKLASLDSSNKKGLVESELEGPSITRQCELLQISRSGYYYEPKPMKPENICILHRMDEIYTDHSFYGYRMIHKQLLEEGFSIGENRVLKYMQILGIQAICPQKKKLTSIKNHEHKIYPYLLKEFHNDRKQVVAEFPNQIWSGDISYVPTAHGFMYLAAIIDWYSKSILSWKLSNTMDAALAVDVLESAIDEYGTPEIFNSDQGSQYTSEKHTKVLKDNGIRISMNGKGRSIDNIAIERFFRTLKYENIYLNNYQSISELRAGIAKYMDFYNYNRFHSSLSYQKPMNVYKQELKIAA